jgi:hypothetical protein
MAPIAARRMFDISYQMSREMILPSTTEISMIALHFKSPDGLARKKPVSLIRLFFLAYRRHSGRFVQRMRAKPPMGFQSTAENACVRWPRI